VQVAEAADGAQQTEPQPAAGGSTKKDKERQRKERQRHRKMEEAMDALDGAMAAMALGARCVSPLWLMCIGRYPPFPGEAVVYVRVEERSRVWSVAAAGRAR
jgi:hypothetical protein